MNRNNAAVGPGAEQHGSPILELKQVRRTFLGPDGAITALDIDALSLAAGEFTAVVGASGAGKSTLLLTAAGLLRPETGTVHLAGIDVYALSAEKRAGLRSQKIGFVFQQFHLIPYLTVFENVLAAAVQDPGDAAERAEILLDRFGLAVRRNHLPSQLSTGERQRTALARALLIRPALILADEPTGNLDEENGEIVLSALKDFAAQGGAVLMVTHDSRAAAFAHRILHMSRGGID